MARLSDNAARSGSSFEGNFEARASLDQVNAPKRFSLPEIPFERSRLELLPQNDAGKIRVKEKVGGPFNV